MKCIPQDTITLKMIIEAIIPIYIAMRVMYKNNQKKLHYILVFIDEINRFIPKFKMEK